MHGTPIYARWAHGQRTRTSFRSLPISRGGSARRTRRLVLGVRLPRIAGATQLGEQARLDSRTPSGRRGSWRPRSTERALTALQRAGCIGAMLWCHSDYEPAVWEHPPLDLAVHERSFGLWRAEEWLRPSRPLQLSRPSPALAGSRCPTTIHGSMSDPRSSSAHPDGSFRASTSCTGAAAPSGTTCTAASSRRRSHTMLSVFPQDCLGGFAVVRRTMISSNHRGGNTECSRRSASPPSPSPRCARSRWACAALAGDRRQILGLGRELTCVGYRPSEARGAVERRRCEGEGSPRSKSPARRCFAPRRAARQLAYHAHIRTTGGRFRSARHGDFEATAVQADSGRDRGRGGESGHRGGETALTGT